MGVINLIGTLFSFFNKTESGSKVGGGIATGLSIAALIPVVIGLYKWFEGHKEDVFMTFNLTYGNIIFVGLIVWAVIEILRAIKPRTGP